MAPTLRQTLIDALQESGDAGPVEAHTPPVALADVHGDVPVETNMFAELALWSATADGELDAEEIVDLAALLRDLPGLEAFDADAANRMVDAMAENFASEEAIAARIAELAVSLRTRKLQRASYQLALWSAARDGHFTEDETDFLEALQDCLGIDDDEAQQLLHATIEFERAEG